MAVPGPVSPRNGTAFERSISTTIAGINIESPSANNARP
jgi:hypothetical protein